MKKRKTIITKSESMVFDRMQMEINNLVYEIDWNRLDGSYKRMTCGAGQLVFDYSTCNYKARNWEMPPWQY